MQEFIRSIREQHDATILLCTHDMAEAEALADRIGILHEGALICLDTAEALKAAHGADTLEGAFMAATGPPVRGRGRRGVIRFDTVAARRELVGFAGIVERNTYLIRRFVWWEVAWFLYTVANTLTIVFIAKGAEAAGYRLDVNRETIVLLIGAVVWSYLGLLFEIVTETVAWERWEGTIEYTFMAPLSRPAHLLGMGAFAVVYGVLRTILLFGVVSAFLDVTYTNADFGSAMVVIAVSSFSFVGIGMMTAVLPLISPEKGTQLGFIAQGLLLVISGVYYPVSVLPQWMQWLSVISPATYTLEGARKAILDGAGRRGALGRDLAAPPDRRHRDPRRPGRVRAGRALRQAARPAQAVGLASASSRRGLSMSVGSSIVCSAFVGHDRACRRRRTRSRASPSRGFAPESARPRSPSALTRLGLGLHPLHRQLARVVERLGEVLHLDVLARPSRSACEHALVRDVVDAACPSPCRRGGSRPAAASRSPGLRGRS